MGRVRKQQMKQILAGKRKLLLGPWFRPKLVQSEMPVSQRSVSGQRQLEKLLASEKGKNFFNGRIARIGFVNRQARRERKRAANFKIPVSEIGFFDWYAASKSREKKSLQAKESKTAKTRGRLPEAVPFNLGLNSIIEIGKGAHGEPTHIILIRRPMNVATTGAGYWDLPAGLLMAGKNPVDAVNARSAAEIGIDKSKLKLIGKGLKPVKKETWFALHRMDNAAVFNAFFVQRANVSAEEVRKSIRARIRSKKDAWAPAGFAIIPRTSEAIREFIRTHDKTVIPEALRLYAMELAKAKK
ncbi:MAG TPA: NUDIX domain-containing protein [archaeon]|nr:NUDIX domain-containing protein [archaeon]